MKVFQQLHASERAETLPLPIYRELNASEHKESADNYWRLIARLNVRWRVIECRDGIQWILQHTDGKKHGRMRWTGRSYCRTRDGLIRACRDNAGEIDAIAMMALESLPDWIGG
ncbi:hypothetical protein ASD64_19380 [Mesorhizobium sp. Root157]|uniref:hypothetical protein n=1 Tax=Mesorhizobium sp. Root157 TaxID=1736477 RepID=UPI000700FD69|nr:hypothetical protein [Mesorhizobium sp. Root157]KQZ92264.1 hypothetical protein ASD64_19380 [Mesorhizobium sp. Root157]